MYCGVSLVTKKEIEDAIKNAVETAKSKSSAGPSGKSQRKKTKRLFPFKVDETGTYRRVERESDDGVSRGVWVRFMSAVSVKALTRNEDGENWGRYVEILDRDNVVHHWAMPAALFAGSGEALRAELLRLGCEIEPRREARSWVLEYLQSAEPEARARCVSRIGWHGETYVLPDGAIGASDDGEQVLLQTQEKPDHAFNVAGTIEDWQVGVAGPALGNSRLVLAISAGFAAPMLALSSDDGGGFHFRGASSSGKSTALTVAGSVWGGGGTQGFVRHWRATDNALESVAGMSCDSLLCLDELSQVEPKAAGAAAYMLANGKGKARAGREGQARKVLEWRVLFLSNGEIALSDKIKEGGGRIAAGMEVRVIDLRADAGAGMGVFENIHDAKDPADFAQRLKKSSNSYYGAAGRAFVAAIVEDMAQYRDQLAKLRKGFVEGTLPPDSDGQVSRVADRFALVAAAGEIATAIGITAWPAGAALSAAQRCFADWLAERGGVGSSEVGEAKRRLAETLQLHGSSRFQRWARSSSDRVIITNRLGFVKIEGEPDVEEVESTYFFMAEPLKEIFAGLDFRAVVTELVGSGVIVDQGGKPNKVFHVSSGGGKHRLYQIDRDKLDIVAGQ